MKKAILLMLIWLIVSQAHAQVTGTISYQAVARDLGGNFLPNANLSIKLSVLQGIPAGPTVYEETHFCQTNDLGLFHLYIGAGTPVAGNFDSINWGFGAKYLKVEVDPTGGTMYFLLGVSQLASVPFALFAKEAGNGGDTDSTNEIQYLSLNENSLLLSGGGGQVSLAAYHDSLKIVGDSLMITNGNAVRLPVGSNPVSNGVHGSVAFTSGTHQWTVPFWVNQVYFELWGAGGGGGGGLLLTVSGCANIVKSGGTGGSGGYLFGNCNVKPGDVLTISVGQGGAAGSNATYSNPYPFTNYYGLFPGATGGSSKIMFQGSSDSLVAKGGTGGGLGSLMYNMSCTFTDQTVMDGSGGLPLYEFGKGYFILRDEQGGIGQNPGTNLHGRKVTYSGHGGTGNAPGTINMINGENGKVIIEW